MRHLILTGLLICSSLGLSAQGSAPKAEPRVQALDATICELYTLISGPEGKARDLGALRALLHPDAQHAFVHRGPDGTPLLRRFELEAFLQFTQPVWEKGFYEQEVGRRVEVFGNLAHAFSTYEVRLKPEGPVVRRGINSFQFVHDGKRWRLLSALWEGESADSPIPSRYLERP
jgi:hypothetical protein